MTQVIFLIITLENIQSWLSGKQSLLILLQKKPHANIIHVATFDDRTRKSSREAKQCICHWKRTTVDQWKWDSVCKDFKLLGFILSFTRNVSFDNSMHQSLYLFL